MDLSQRFKRSCQLMKTSSVYIFIILSIYCSMYTIDSLYISMSSIHSSHSTSLINKDMTDRYNSEHDVNQQQQQPMISTDSKSPFSMSIDELSNALGGLGKAKNFWSLIRDGKDIFCPDNSLLSSKTKETIAELFKKQISYSRVQQQLFRQRTKLTNDESIEDEDNLSIYPTTIQTETISPCGGRKQLHTLSSDHLQIESVLIPHQQLPRTTLCVSNQVGCDRGCVFCATGKMGLVRNLSVDEILSQVYWGRLTAARYGLHPLKNIVFMGMGDIGMNLDAVSQAVYMLIDHQKFAFGSSKVTLSTVGPNPEVFSQLAQLPATLAWSLHSAIPELRKKLVPSSRHYDPTVLRDGLINSLLTYKSSTSHNHRSSVMIAITLLHNINTSEIDAEHLVVFLQPFRDQGIKVNIDLIPYNDIHMQGLERPTDLEIRSFKEVLWKAGYNHSVRLTRGENEASACGMLATKRPPK